jgi:hypothetical protein
VRQPSLLTGCPDAVGCSGARHHARTRAAFVDTATPTRPSSASNPLEATASPVMVVGLDDVHGTSLFPPAMRGSRPWGLEEEAAAAAAADLPVLDYMEDLEARAVGCFLGAMAGNALGAPVQHERHWQVWWALFSEWQVLKVTIPLTHHGQHTACSPGVRYTTNCAHAFVARCTVRCSGCSLRV